MSLNGIGTTRYTTPERETRKVSGDMGKAEVSGASFAKQAAEAAQAKGNAAATLHGAEAGAGESSGDSVVSSWTDVVNGTSIVVCKPQDFDADNPVYRVKTWDRAGNVTEQMVDVSKVDPRNCDTAQMYAYTCHLKESGKGSFEDTVLKAAVAKSVENAERRNAGSWDFAQKRDWVEIVRDIMQSEYHYGDLKGYMEWKKFLDLLE